MRLHLRLKSIGRTFVPFNYQPQLTGAIHKWLGENNWHGGLSLYSFSWLTGGAKSKKGLTFDRGTSFEISAHDTNFIKRIIKGIQSDPSVNFGLAVTDITICDTPAFSEKEIMHLSSPVLIKRTVEERDVHYIYSDNICSDLLTETLKRKLRLAELSDEGIKVSFMSDYPASKTKIIYYNDIGNKVNICPIVIEGSPEQIAFAWNVGVGNSTGIGFGALK